jgi:multidrug efflux system membrane fusion protein
MRLTALILALLLAMPALAAEVVVAPEEIDDRKAVVATVEPVRQLVARARIGGTVVSLKVREGDVMKAGQQIAVVTDQKLALQIEAIEQRIRSQEAQRDQARMDFDRVQELQSRGVTSQAQLDLVRTALNIAERNLSAIQADRNVLNQQAAEGAVLAPGHGRVLTVPVSLGQVMMPGEPVATLAEERYILRLSLPERHAQIMKAGDAVEIAARGSKENEAEQRRKGHVRLVYPEISGGRVMADVEVDGLGDYFVGERTRVYVSTGKRSAFLLPASAIYSRSGAFFVRLKSGVEMNVQPGERRGARMEILSGLRAGDVVVTP